jgi:hypothetical protein
VGVDELDRTMRELRVSVPDHFAAGARTRGDTLMKVLLAATLPALRVAGVLRVSIVLLVRRPPGVIL